MHSSSSDLTNSFGDWLMGRTEASRQPQGWTPEQTLFLDYQKFCEAYEIPPSKRLDHEAFAAELPEHCGRLARKQLVEPEGGGAPRYEPCWPRALLRPIRVAA